MRTLHLLAVGIAVFSATAYAQEPTEKTEVATLNENHQMLPHFANVTPLSLQVAYDKTTHLVFPSAIRYVDLGSENLIADKVKDSENVLRLKAAQFNFQGNTNLSVITQDGGFYNFVVCYHPNPIATTLDFGRGMPQANNVKSDILFSDTGWESPAVAQIIMTSIYHQKKNHIKHIGSQSAKIQWLLKGVYIHNGKLYLDIELRNGSNLPFEVDFISFKTIDKKTSKKSVVQEIAVEPLRVYQPLQVITSRKDSRTVYMLDQLTLSDDKVLRVEVFEKNGSRYQSFLISKEDIQNARPIEQFNLKI